MLTETAATEESRFLILNRPSDFKLKLKKERLCREEGKILRWSMECESRAFPTGAKARLLHSLVQFDVGLLRMTVFNTRSAT
jgi:hypothetical protein